jgi:transcriptional regulator of nitric oxide reductase
MTTQAVNNKGNPVKTNGKTATEPAPAPAAITLQRIEREVIKVRVTGTAPLIVHRFDQKAKQMMLEAQQTKTRAKKLAKDPVADFEASKYLLPDGRDGFPVVAFKAATVGAARMFDGISMVQLKSLLRFHGEGPDQLVPLILDGPPIMREDTVRVGMGTADLRYRAQYFPWSVDLVIEYPPSQISIESIVALVDAGGIGGVGEWRPSSPKGATGSYGTWSVAE